MIGNVYILKSGNTDWELFTCYKDMNDKIVDKGIQVFVERDLDFNIYNGWKRIDKYQCVAMYGDSFDLFRLCLEVQV